MPESMYAVVNQIIQERNRLSHRGVVLEKWLIELKKMMDFIQYYFPISKEVVAVMLET